MKFIVNRLLCVLIFASISLIAQDIKQIDKPERIILNITAQPESSIAVTWRTAMEHVNSAIEYCEAAGGPDSLKTDKTKPVKIEHAILPKNKNAYHYSYIINELKPDSKYMYRVGYDSVWSEWNQFKTASQSKNKIKFTWFGDPQDDIEMHISRVFRQAFKTMPDADLWLFSGDIMTAPEDNLFGEVFNATGFIFRTIPAALTPGNHDCGFLMKDGKIAIKKNGKKERTKIVSQLWNWHFTLPENGAKGLEETSYYFDYQGVRFILINSNDRLEEQGAWMEKLLESNPNKWTVVTFHHPLYSAGRERNELDTRKAFLPIFDKYHVDLVLTGHDHVYARSYKLNNNSVVKYEEPGTIYAVSSSGSKFYEYSPLYKGLMAKTIEKTQMYQTIEINGAKLMYKAYSANEELIDSFEVEK